MGSPGPAVSGEDQPVNDAEIIDHAVYLRSLFPTGRRVILFLDAVPLLDDVVGRDSDLLVGEANRFSRSALTSPRRAPVVNAVHR